ncbi:uncharacterized protein LOC111024904 [Momordica charantia]|uniref:Uncharacterized protein LOC111024904 n=1 Tax=Momordica charantia TaxID=3673 RepID=A0A6J1DZB9_MOMCH|nr:uncharacterized protein LOC111024904 [Momordica charantia]
MDFQAATDAIKCRAFQIALTGSARLWYRRLPARSISTYSQLRKEFISQFSSWHYDRKTATHLATIRQKERETLREYVTRFQEEQLKVAHCSDDSAMCYFLTSLADETLTVKLGEEAPTTFVEVLQKAKKVIDGQELLRTKTGRPEKQIDQKKLSQEKRKADSKSRDKGSSSSASRTEYRRLESGPSRSRPYERYTSSTIPISEILTNIEESGMEKLLKRPEKLRGDLEKRNKEKYCRFHRDHGHNTTSCWELKRQIEDLIQDGYFKKFVGKPRSNSVEKKEERKRSRTPPRREDRPAVINTIFGGPNGGQSGNKRKELAREARREVCIIREHKPTCSITFGDADLEGVHLPHNDALVIASLIDHDLVRRVLIDGGCIDLPVTIGQDATQVTQMAEFVVIDGRSAYNAIFGRPIIHSFRAVPSTLHQVLKYSTPNEVGMVRGEQKTSRECYASALKGSAVCALEEQTNRGKLQESEADLPKEGKRQFPPPTEELELVPLLSPERQANPEKIKTVLEMEAPKTLKQLQCLNGRIAALNRFVSRSTDKCLPFFKFLRKKGSFEWTVECEQALEQLKNYLCSAPLLAKPLPGEKLHLYLAVSDNAVSSALIK